MLQKMRTRALEASLTRLADPSNPHQLVNFDSVEALDNRST